RGDILSVSLPERGVNRVAILVNAAPEGGLDALPPATAEELLSVIPRFRNGQAARGALPPGVQHERGRVRVALAARRDLEVLRQVRARTRNRHRGVAAGQLIPLQAARPLVARLLHD